MEALTVKQTIYRYISVGTTLLFAALSVADSYLFARIIAAGGSFFYGLYILSLLGAAGFLCAQVLRPVRRPWRQIAGLLWAFGNAFAFLLFPAESHTLTAKALPLPWLFTPVLYFFLMAVTTVAVFKTIRWSN